MDDKKTETFGICGDNLTWYYRDGGFMYISGSGPMVFDQVPWEAWKDQICEVYFDEEFTAICANAFRDCRKLSSVNLPDELEYIGESAFEGCISLQAVCIATQEFEWIELADRALRNCESLVDWNANVKVVGKQVFENCKKLQFDKFKMYHENNDIVKLHCETCGTLNDSPLTIYHEYAFENTSIAAYIKGIIWNKEVPVPGAVLEIKAVSPFCCQVGNTFSSLYSDTQLVKARLLSIISSGRYEANIQIEVIAVIEIKDRMSFIQPVSVTEKKRMKINRSYSYDAPVTGDSPYPQIRRIDTHTVCLSKSFGGDITCSDYIYTADDGIDHLIMREYSDFEVDLLFAGDQVLGFHTDAPYYEKNGLIIDPKEKTVIQCLTDATEVVIPQGVVRLHWYSFYPCTRLERITIPDSVTDIDGAFYCSNLKEVILTGKSGLKKGDFSDIAHAKIRRIP